MKQRLSIQQYIDAFAKAGILAKTEFVGSANSTILEQSVSYVTYDSTQVKEGTMFFCKGAHFKEAYLTDAFGGGAFAYVSETLYEKAESGVALDKGALRIIVTDIKAAMALTANLFYEEAWRRLKTIGITGTKGKSTTAYFLKAILDEALPKESAILSSIDNYDGVSREESRLTTSESLVLHEHFSNAAESGITHLTMEVSSQALKYGRTDGVILDIGIFMNVGRDHISPIEHPSLEDYVASKMLIFNQCRRAIINKDCSVADQALQKACESHRVERIVTFSVDRGDREEALSVGCLGKEHIHYLGTDIKAGKKTVSFRVLCGAEKVGEYTIGLPGIFNVGNALAAVAAARELGIDSDSIREGLLKARVPGRMEVFTDKEEKKVVLVDYAHNAMSYHALFDAVDRDYPGMPKYIVFGCPGSKALGRRKELGRIAGQRADYSYLTEEDAGEEDIVAICKEIATHIEEVGGQYEIDPDRYRAIRKSIFDTPEQSVILVMAKGRETRQKRGTTYETVRSDVDLVEEYLMEYDAR